MEEIVEKLEETKKTYITLEQIEELLNKKLTYIEFANIIKQLISDGILKSIWYRYEWENSITFFEI